MSKKLIEVYFPFDLVSLDVEKEKATRNGRLSSLHLWWGRRPVAESWLLLFASIIDDPSAHTDVFETEEEQRNERDRLWNVCIEGLRNEDSLEQVKYEINRYEKQDVPLVLDPFMGGGSIPLAAQKMGLDSVSSDLNSVSVLIGKALIEIPSEFKNESAINNDFQMNLIEEDNVGIITDVKHYGEQIYEKLKIELADVYPRYLDEEGQLADVSSWIWTRTVKCPNPSCKCEIPLSTNYHLTRKKGKEAWAEPIYEAGKLKFKIRHSKMDPKMNKSKMGQSAIFKCPMCGEITTPGYVKEMGNMHQINSKMIAAVIDRDGNKQYVEPDKIQISASKIEKPKEIPHGKIPQGSNTFRVTAYGIDDYADLFSNRQLLFLSKLVQEIKNTQKVIEKEAVLNGFSDETAKAYSEAICLYLGMAVSKMTERFSSLVTWDSTEGGKVCGVFTRAVLPMVWDYVETNPFVGSSGNYLKILNSLLEVVKQVPCKGKGKVFSGDAATIESMEENLIITDLPYYDRIDYAGLSDYFYIWLRYIFKDVYQDKFVLPESDKENDLSCFAYHQNGDMIKEKKRYANKLAEIFEHLYKASSKTFPSVFSYIYVNDGKRFKDISIAELSEWEVFITSLIENCFEVTACWPLGRNKEEKIELAEKKGIPISVVVRHKNNVNGQVTRRRFISFLKKELEIEIEKLLNEEVEINDLKVCLLGKAWNTFSRYEKVIDADGNTMKVSVASRIIEQELEQQLQHRFYNESIITEEDITNG